MSSDEGEGEEEGEEISLLMVMVLRVLRMEKCSWKRETAVVVAIFFSCFLFLFVLSLLTCFALRFFASFTLLINHKHQLQLRDCLFTSGR